jgi:hypothetical protein
MITEVDIFQMKMVAQQYDKRRPNIPTSEHYPKVSSLKFSLHTTFRDLNLEQQFLRKL